MTSGEHLSKNPDTVDGLGASRGYTGMHVEYPPASGNTGKRLLALLGGDEYVEARSNPELKPLIEEAYHAGAEGEEHAARIGF